MTYRGPGFRAVPRIGLTLCAIFMLAGVVATLSPVVAEANSSPHRPGTRESHTYSGQTGAYPYLVYTPKSYDPRVAMPVVVMVHGCNTTAEQQANANLFDPLADREGFLVVYPDTDASTGVAAVTAGGSSLESGLGSTHPVACWRIADSRRGVGDAEALAGITREVMGDWRVDDQRVYLVGMSSGAFMASVMAATYPDLYAAIGIAEGAAYAAAEDAFNPVGPMVEQVQLEAMLAFQAMGNSARIVPVLDFQGDQDTTVYPQAGHNAVQQWLMTDNLVAGGAMTGPLRLTPSDTRSGARAGGYGYSVDSYRDPAGCLAVEQVRIQSMGHYWPGGTKDPAWAQWTDWKAPSGAELSWNFFRRYRKSDTVLPCVETRSVPSVTSVPAPQSAASGATSSALPLTSGQHEVGTTAVLLAVLVVTIPVMMARGRRRPW